MGNYSGHRQLSLSEVESRNSAFQHVQQDAASSQASSALVDTQGGHATQDKGVAESPDAPKKGPAALDGSDYGASIRLYASEGRMWYALAGHGPDLNKIKGMDFDCLSIIAASGPNGIYQHDLIKSSGQDKRSLPARTDRLHEAGYIEKKRLTIQLCKPKKMLHTSLCTMKRFVKNVPDQALQLQSGAEIIIPETRDAIEERSDSNQDGQKHKQSPSPAAGEIQHKHTSQSNPRTVPQWTVDKPINNQIFELVDRSGIQGMSMNVCLGLCSTDGMDLLILL